MMPSNKPTLKLPVDQQRFKRSEEYLKTYSEKILPNPKLREKFRQFMELKRGDPTASFGSSDYSFGAVGPLGKTPNLKHAHITFDISIVYRVVGNIVYLYGFYTHDELGTGTPPKIKTQKSMSDKFQHMQFESDSEHRRTLQRTGMWGKMGAGCLLLAQDTGRIGIAKRSAYVQSPGTLGTVGGALDTDKSPDKLTEEEIQAGVHKEVDEELGYRGPMELVKLMTAQIPTRDGSTFFYFNYLAIVPTEFKPHLNWENDALLWMTLDELQQQDGLHRGVRGLLNDPGSMAKIRAAVGNKGDDSNTVNEDTLTEGATDTLFYYRRLHGALRTLEDGYFSLSSSTGTGVEEKYTPPGKPFFLSTTRSKVGDYHRWVGDSAVMFNLDGRWIEQRYQVEPMDYWYAGKTPDTLKRGEWKTIDPTSKRAMWDFPGSGRTSESEDRIFSNKNVMPITPVTAVHVYYRMEELANEKNDQIRTFGAYVNRIIQLCQKREIPVFVYGNVNDWKTQNPKRRISLDYVQKLTGNLKMPEQRQSMRWMGPWIELIKAGKSADLSKDADKLRYNMMYYSDTITQLNNDLHNSRKPGSGDYDDVVFINKFMLKNKLKNTRELMDYLKSKWKNIYSIENPREGQ